MPQSLSPRGLMRAWAVAVVGSVGVNELLRSALQRGLAVPETFLPFSRPAVLFWTVVGVTAGAAAFALVARWAAEPVGTYRRVAAAALVLSWVPDILIVGSPRFPEATWQAAFGLGVLHLPPAAACILLYPWWGLRR